MYFLETSDKRRVEHIFKYEEEGGSFWQDNTYQAKGQRVNFTRNFKKALKIPQRRAREIQDILRKEFDLRTTLIFTIGG